MIKKSADGTLTDAEFALLQNQDLATLSSYEQAKNLTVTLLKKWLVEYKFKNWKTHSSTKKNVTKKEKEIRAEEIAEQLGNNKLWHSHGRMIGIIELTSLLKLKIEDYSDEDELRESIRSYNDLITEYISNTKLNFFFHSKKHF